VALCDLAGNSANSADPTWMGHEGYRLGVAQLDHASGFVPNSVGGPRDLTCRDLG
jgi:hypothetical protein